MKPFKVSAETLGLVSGTLGPSGVLTWEPNFRSKLDDLEHYFEIRENPARESWYGTIFAWVTASKMYAAYPNMCGYTTPKLVKQNQDNSLVAGILEITL